MMLILYTLYLILKKIKCVQDFSKKSPNLVVNPFFSTFQFNFWFYKFGFNFFMT
jgi:hypothetical protein